MIVSRAICTVGALLLLWNCSKSESDSGGGDGVDPGDSTITLTLKTPDPVDASGFALTTGFQNTAIASGPAKELTLYIEKMVLSGDAGSKTIFYSAKPKGIAVKDGRVDVSDLFTEYQCVKPDGVPVEEVTDCPCGLDDEGAAVAANEDGTCPATGSDSVGVLAVNSGSYDELTVSFGVRAKMKGCVTGNFGTIGSNGPETQGEHTYCTIASGHTFQDNDETIDNTLYEVAESAAETMDVQVSKYNAMYTAAEIDKTVNLSFPINGGVTVEKDGEAPNLNLLIDPNRLLRYYNNNITQAPNPGMWDTRPYFFSTVFEESVFVFVGAVGSIQGYSWMTTSCNASPMPDDRLCTGQTGSVAGWSTFVIDSDGTPILGSAMPDDDNTLTIIKGSNKSMAGIDQDAFVANGSTYDFTLKLGDNMSATYYGLDFTTEVGEVLNTTFVGFQDYYGAIAMERGL